MRGIVVVSILACLGTVACHHAPEHGHAEVHWGYAGDTGPEHWAELSPEFAPCGAGTEQSPIDLRMTEAVPGRPMQNIIGNTILSVEQRAHVMDLIETVTRSRSRTTSR